MNKHAKNMRNAAVICRRADLLNIAASCEQAALEIERLEQALEQRTGPPLKGSDSIEQVAAELGLPQRRGSSHG